MAQSYQKFSRSRFCLYFVLIIFLRKCSKLKMLFYQYLYSTLKGRGENGKSQAGGIGGNAESSAVAQTAISVFLSQKKMWEHYAYNHTFKWELHGLYSDPLKWGTDWMSFPLWVLLLSVGPTSSLFLSLLTSAGSNWQAPVFTTFFLWTFVWARIEHGFCVHAARAINPQTKKHYGILLTNQSMS